MRAYSCYGGVRGDCNHKHRTIRAARKCLLSDDRDCERAGGYSDRTQLRVFEGANEAELSDAEIEEWHCDHLDLV